jgi:alpha-galactosidase
MMFHRRLLCCSFLSFLALMPARPCQGLTNGLALTPPMGWNSWNNFGCGIDEWMIRRMADAMATNGMKAAGYQYINLDDC